VKILNQTEKVEINLQNMVGICRPVDSLGRIVIPKEIRKYLRRYRTFFVRYRLKHSAKRWDGNDFYQTGNLDAKTQSKGLEQRYFAECVVMKANCFYAVFSYDHKEDITRSSANKPTVFSQT